MNRSDQNCRLPRTLACPHCRAQMNFTGRGKAPGSVTYFCGRCVPLLRVKELWLGQVIRTGNLGFGFVQLHGPSGLGGVHFRIQDFASGADGPNGAPRVGDGVLVLLDDDPQHARRVWRVPSPPVVSLPRPANGQPARAPRDNRPRRANGSARRSGIITRVVGPDWGFVTELATGRELFVHQRDLQHGAALVQGQRVTYLPATTPKGLRACEVHPG